MITNIKKELKKLFIPIFIETLLVTMLGVMDTFMLSQYSDDAVAAAGIGHVAVALADVDQRAHHVHRPLLVYQGDEW